MTFFTARPQVARLPQVWAILRQLPLRPPSPGDSEWLLSKAPIQTPKTIAVTHALLVAARVGSSTLNLLVKAGAKEVDEEWPKPAEARYLWTGR